MALFRSCGSLHTCNLFGFTIVTKLFTLSVGSVCLTTSMPLFWVTEPLVWLLGLFVCDELPEHIQVQWINLHIHSKCQSLSFVQAWIFSVLSSFADKLIFQVLQVHLILSLEIPGLTRSLCIDVWVFSYPLAPSGGPKTSLAVGFLHGITTHIHCQCFQVSHGRDITLSSCIQLNSNFVVVYFQCFWPLLILSIFLIDIH